MEDEDYSDRAIEAVMYGNDEEKRMVAGALKLFMNLYNYNKFYSEYDISEDQYNEHFRSTIRKYSENWHQFAMQEFERERKYKK